MLCDVNKIGRRTSSYFIADVTLLGHTIKE